MKYYQNKILNLLLDKYENRLDTSNRRVLLHCNKQDIIPHPEEAAYAGFLTEMLELRKQKLIELDWIRKDCIIRDIWLNLSLANTAYHLIGRSPRSENLTAALRNLDDFKSQIHTAWISDYLQEQRSKMTASSKPEGIWSLSPPERDAVLKSLLALDEMNGETISMRAFSIRLYSDSKFFEREIRKRIVPIILQYYPAFSDLDDISDREALAQVGILMMPEVFEFCGNVQIQFSGGMVDFSPMLHGSCISGVSVHDIQNIILSGVNEILFIENKTNYTEYCIHSRKNDELVIYHGGFYSPDKAFFLHKLMGAADDIPAFFWGDIDLGGFHMFLRLKTQIVPQLQPKYMGIEDFLKYAVNGLKRPSSYRSKVALIIQDAAYSCFHDVAEEIIKTGVTVEQESFLES